jgi:hypothetical protein
MCFTVTCQKNLGSVGIILFFFKLSAKPEIVVPGSESDISFFKFPVSRHLLKLFYDELHSFCSQFRQKASGWINKTLLLIKKQKWLSEFCVKIDRVASKN